MSVGGVGGRAGFGTVLKRVLVGRSKPSSLVEHSRLPKVLALPIFSSDALSSVAYATEQILFVLLGASVAAGVGRLDDAEIGFSIAYLKRALRSTHLALQSLHDIREKRCLPEKASDHITRRLVTLRDEIVSEVMSLRQVWREKFSH